MRRTKEDADKTRQLLMDAATQVFNAKGYKAANLDEIAEAAHVTRGAIAWHFKNKKNLFREMVRANSDGAMQITMANFELGISPAEKMKLYIDFIISDRFIKQDQIGVVNKLLNEKPDGFEDLIQKIKDASNFIIEELRDAIETGIKEKVFKSNLNPDLTAKALYTFTWGFFANFSLLFASYSEEDLHAFISAFFSDVLNA